MSIPMLDYPQDDHCVHEPEDERDFPIVGPVREPECACGRCGEGLYFVQGVVGPSRWRHCRTELAECRPLCQKCGKPGTVRVYSPSNAPYWECETCSKKTFRIERIS